MFYYNISFRCLDVVQNGNSYFVKKDLLKVLNVEITNNLNLTIENNNKINITNNNYSFSLTLNVNLPNMVFNSLQELIIPIKNSFNPLIYNNLKIKGFNSIEIVEYQNQILKLKLDNNNVIIPFNINENCSLVNSPLGIIFTNNSGKSLIFTLNDQNILISNQVIPISVNDEIIFNINKSSRIDTSEVLIGIKKVNSGIILFGNNFKNVILTDLKQSSGVSIIKNNINNFIISIGGFQYKIENNKEYFCKKILQATNQDVINQIEDIGKYNGFLFFIENLNKLKITYIGQDILIQNDEILFLKPPASFLQSSDNSFNLPIIQKGNDIILRNFNIILEDLVSLEEYINIDIKVGSNNITLNNVFIEPNSIVKFNYSQDNNIFNWNTKNPINNIPGLLIIQNSTKTMILYKGMVINTQFSNNFKLYFDESNEKIYIENNDGSIFQCNDDIDITEHFIDSYTIIGNNSFTIPKGFSSIVQKTDYIYVVSKECPAGIKIYNNNSNFNYIFSDGLINFNNKQYILNKGEFQQLLFNSSGITNSQIFAHKPQYGESPSIIMNNVNLAAVDFKNLYLWTNNQITNTSIKLFEFFYDMTNYSQVIYNSDTQQLSFNGSIFFNATDVIFSPNGIQKILSNITINNVIYNSKFLKQKENISILFGNSDISLCKNLIFSKDILNLPKNVLSLNFDNQILNYNGINYNLLLKDYNYVVLNNGSSFFNDKISITNNRVNQIWSNKNDINKINIYNNVDSMLIAWKNVLDLVAINDNEVLINFTNISNYKTKVYLKGSHDFIVHDTQDLLIEEYTGYVILKIGNSNNLYYLFDFIANKYINAVINNNTLTIDNLIVQDFNYYFPAESTITNSIVPYISNVAFLGKNQDNNLLLKNNLFNNINLKDFFLIDLALNPYFQININQSQNNFEIFINNNNNLKIKKNNSFFLPINVDNSVYRTYNLFNHNINIKTETVIYTDINNLLILLNNYLVPVIIIDFLNINNHYYDSAIFNIKINDITINDINNNNKDGSIFFPQGTYLYKSINMNLSKSFFMQKYGNNGVLNSSVYTGTNDFEAELINFFQGDNQYNSITINTVNTIINNIVTYSNVIIGVLTNIPFKSHRSTIGPNVTAEITGYHYKYDNTLMKIQLNSNLLLSILNVFNTNIDVLIKNTSVIANNVEFKGDRFSVNINAGANQTIFGVSNVNVLMNGIVTLYSDHDLIWEFTDPTYGLISYTFIDWNNNAAYNNTSFNGTLTTKLASFFEFNNPNTHITNLNNFIIFPNINTQKIYTIDNNLVVTVEPNTDLYLKIDNNGYIFYSNNLPNGTAFPMLPIKKEYNLSFSNISIGLSDYRLNLNNINGLDFKLNGNITLNGKIITINSTNDLGLFVYKSNNDLIIVKDNIYIQNFFLENTNITIDESEFSLQEGTNIITKKIKTEDLIFVRNLNTINNIFTIINNQNNWTGYKKSVNDLIVILPDEQYSFTCKGFYLDNGSKFTHYIDINKKILVDSIAKTLSINNQQFTPLGINNDNILCNFTYFPFDNTSTTYNINEISIWFKEPIIINKEITINNNGLIKFQGLISNVSWYGLLCMPQYLFNNSLTSFHRNNIPINGEKADIEQINDSTNLTTKLNINMKIGNTTMPQILFFNNINEVIFPISMGETVNIGTNSVLNVYNNTSVPLIAKYNGNILFINNMIFENKNIFNIGSTIKINETSIEINTINYNLSSQWKNGLFFFQSNVDSNGFLTNNYKINALYPIIYYYLPNTKEIDFSVNNSGLIKYYTNADYNFNFQLGINGNINGILSLNSNNFNIKTWTDVFRPITDILLDTVILYNTGSFMNNGLKIVQIGNFYYVEGVDYALNNIFNSEILRPDISNFSNNSLGCKYNGFNFLKTEKYYFLGLKPNDNSDIYTTAGGLKIQALKSIANDWLGFMFYEKNGSFFAYNMNINLETFNYLKTNNMLLQIDKDYITVLNSSNAIVIKIKYIDRNNLLELRINTALNGSKIFTGYVRNGADAIYTNSNGLNNVYLSNYYSSISSSTISASYGAGIDLLNSNNINLIINSVSKPITDQIFTVTDGFNSFTATEFKDFYVMPTQNITNTLFIDDNKLSITNASAKVLYGQRVKINNNTVFCCFNQTFSFYKVFGSIYSESNFTVNTSSITTAFGNISKSFGLFDSINNNITLNSLIYLFHVNVLSSDSFMITTDTNQLNINYFDNLLAIKTINIDKTLLPKIPSLSIDLSKSKDNNLTTELMNISINNLFFSNWLLQKDSNPIFYIAPNTTVLVSTINNVSIKNNTSSFLLAKYIFDPAYPTEQMLLINNIYFEKSNVINSNSIITIDDISVTLNSVLYNFDWKNGVRIIDQSGGRKKYFVIDYVGLIVFYQIINSKLMNFMVKNSSNLCKIYMTNANSFKVYFGSSGATNGVIGMPQVSDNLNSPTLNFTIKTWNDVLKTTNDIIFENITLYQEQLSSYFGSANIVKINNYFYPRNLTYGIQDLTNSIDLNSGIKRFYARGGSSSVPATLYYDNIQLTNTDKYSFIGIKDNNLDSDITMFNNTKFQAIHDELNDWNGFFCKQTTNSIKINNVDIDQNALTFIQNNDYIIQVGKNFINLNKGLINYKFQSYNDLNSKLSLSKDVNNNDIFVIKYRSSRNLIVSNSNGLENLCLVDYYSNSLETDNTISLTNYGIGLDEINSSDIVLKINNININPNTDTMFQVTNGIDTFKATNTKNMAIIPKSSSFLVSNKLFYQNNQTYNIVNGCSLNFTNNQSNNSFAYVQQTVVNDRVVVCCYNQLYPFYIVYKTLEKGYSFNISSTITFGGFNMKSIFGIYQVINNAVNFDNNVISVVNQLSGIYNNLDTNYSYLIKTINDFCILDFHLGTIKIDNTLINNVTAINITDDNTSVSINQSNAVKNYTLCTNINKAIVQTLYLINPLNNNVNITTIHSGVASFFSDLIPDVYFFKYYTNFGSRPTQILYIDFGSLFDNHIFIGNTTKYSVATAKAKASISSWSLKDFITGNIVNSKKLAYYNNINTLDTNYMKIVNGFAILDINNSQLFAKDFLMYIKSGSYPVKILTTGTIIDFEINNNAINIKNSTTLASVPVSLSSTERTFLALNSITDASESLGGINFNYNFYLSPILKIIEGNVSGVRKYTFFDSSNIIYVDSFSQSLNLTNCSINYNLIPNVLNEVSGPFLLELTGFYSVDTNNNSYSYYPMVIVNFYMKKDTNIINSVIPIRTSISPVKYKKIDFSTFKSKFPTITTYNSYVDQTQVRYNRLGCFDDNSQTSLNTFFYKTSISSIMAAKAIYSTDSLNYNTDSTVSTSHNGIIKIDDLKYVLNYYNASTGLYVGSYDYVALQNLFGNGSSTFSQ